MSENLYCGLPGKQVCSDNYDGICEMKGYCNWQQIKPPKKEEG